MSIDTMRAARACHEILDGRHPTLKMGEIMVTTEHVVATVLLAVMGGDARKAAGMLNEGLVNGVEHRISMYAAKQAGKL